MNEMTFKFFLHHNGIERSQVKDIARYLGDVMSMVVPATGFFCNCNDYLRLTEQRFW